MQISICLLWIIFEFLLNTAGNSEHGGTDSKYFDILYTTLR